MNLQNSFKQLFSAALIVSGALVAASVRPEQTIHGQVVGAGAPIANSTVTLWEASAGEAKKLAYTQTGPNGRFQLRAGRPAAESILYLTAAGGESRASARRGEDSVIMLLSVLGNRPPDQVVVNELTSVASVFTSARFIHGTAISGNPLGLRIAAGNAPNLVDPKTGSWGKALLDPINSTQTATLATLNTLGSLVTASFTVADDGWRARFFKAATPTGGMTPTNTLEAIAGVAREPWNAPKELYALFDEAYPQPKDGSRRAAPFLPYLSLVPPDFALSLCFAGGGMYANGRLMFDKEGNLWSGQNWMPGSQSNVIHNIGGGVLKMAPDGTPLSPPIKGFRGMGLEGVGWGTAVTDDRVWASGFNGKILVMDLNGNPVAAESNFPFKQKVFGLMGIGVAENGDVWIADGSGNQLLYFPGGRIKDGKIVKVAGLASPFDVIVDPQNRVWVSNSQSDTLLRFPADDPTKVETFHAGISVRALALDQKGNLWVTSNMSPNFPMPKMAPGTSIMEQFKILALAGFKYPKPTGIVSMFRPDGTQSAPLGYDGGGALNGPWGVNIDGNGDVWVGNIKNRSAVLMAGDGTKGHAAGVKTGDVIHRFTGGTIQMITDVAIDPAGNVWVANNWNSPEAIMSPSPDFAISTWAGGSGLTVIYGVAAPVKPPRIGLVKGY
jgi:streptogramin lyase